LASQNVRTPNCGARLCGRCGGGKPRSENGGPAGEVSEAHLLVPSVSRAKGVRKEALGGFLCLRIAGWAASGRKKKRSRLAWTSYGADEKTRGYFCFAHHRRRAPRRKCGAKQFGERRVEGRSGGLPKKSVGLPPRLRPKALWTVLGRRRGAADGTSGGRRFPVEDVVLPRLGPRLVWRQGFCPHPCWSQTPPPHNPSAPLIHPSGVRGRGFLKLSSLKHTLLPHITREFAPGVFDSRT